MKNEAQPQHQSVQKEVLGAGSPWNTERALAPAFSRDRAFRVCRFTSQSPGPARQRAFCAREPGRERVAGTARGAAFSAPVAECLASAPCGRRLRYLCSISIAAEPVKITSASQTSVRTIWLRPLFQGSV